MWIWVSDRTFFKAFVSCIEQSRLGVKLANVTNNLVHSVYWSRRPQCPHLLIQHVFLSRQDCYKLIGFDADHTCHWVDFTVARPILTRRHCHVSELRFAKDKQRQLSIQLGLMRDHNSHPNPVFACYWSNTGASFSKLIT